MDRKKFFSLCFLIAGSALIHSVCAAAPLMVEKNLFAPDRKGPSPESDVAAQPTQLEGLALSSIQLDGIMIKGNTRKALVRLKSSPGAVPAGVPQPSGAGPAKAKSPFMSVSEGQQIGEFRVSKVESKSISLEKEGQSFVINIIAANKVVSPPALSPAPQPIPQPVPPPVQPVAGNQPPQNQAVMAQPQMMQGGQQVPPPNPGTPGYIDPALNPQLQQNQEIPPPVPEEEPPQAVPEQ